MKRILFLFLSMFYFNVWAGGEHAHGQERKENQESAKKHEEEDEAIELSPEAVKNFGIKVEKIVPKSQRAEIPISAVVDSKDKKQIFIFHDGKYEIRDVNIVKRSQVSVTIDSFSEPEDVVVRGVNFLKVVEMSHGEESGGGHGH